MCIRDRDTYQNEAEEFFANRKAGQTAPVFLRGERFDLATLNQYIKDEMSKMITYHLNLSKDAMMETVEGLQGGRDLILIFALICLFASTMVVFTLMRTVMHPIRQIVRGVDHFKETGNKEGTVSYTHLDVYKRQTIVSPPTAWGWSTRSF